MKQAYFILMITFMVVVIGFAILSFVDKNGSFATVDNLKECAESGFQAGYYKGYLSGLKIANGIINHSVGDVDSIRDASYFIDSCKYHNAITLKP